MSALRAPRLAGHSEPPSGAVERDALPVLDALLSDGHSTLVPVRGASMRPALIEGDVVVVSPFLGLPRPGQIVLARTDRDRLVVHRLVAVEWGGPRRVYRLQGDAEQAPDTGVLREHLLGRVTAVVRNGLRLPIEDPAFAPDEHARRRIAARRARRLLRGAGLVSPAGP